MVHTSSSFRASSPLPHKSNRNRGRPKSKQVVLGPRRPPGRPRKCSTPLKCAKGAATAAKQSVGRPPNVRNYVLCCFLYLTLISPSFRLSVTRMHRRIHFRYAATSTRLPDHFCHCMYNPRPPQRPLQVLPAPALHLFNALSLTKILSASLKSMMTMMRVPMMGKG